MMITVKLDVTSRSSRVRIAPRESPSTYIFKLLPDLATQHLKVVTAHASCPFGV